MGFLRCATPTEIDFEVKARGGLNHQWRKAQGRTITGGYNRMAGVLGVEYFVVGHSPTPPLSDPTGYPRLTMKTLVNGLNEPRYWNFVARFGQAKLVSRADGRVEL